MDRLSFTAAAGMQEFSLPRTQLNNEIANISTPGFKRSFANVSQTLKVSGPGFDTRFTPTNIYKDQVSLAPGSVVYTGNRLDVALNDSTVLGVSAANGDLAFTRRGDLRVNSAGVLETGAGQAVRGQNGPISIPSGYAIDIAPDGSVYASNPDNANNAPPVLVGRMLLRDASKTPLVRRPDGLFTPEATLTGGNPDITDGGGVPSLKAQSLESSNVSSYDALVRLLEMNRSFEMNVKAIKEARSLDESGSSMLKVA